MDRRVERERVFIEVCPAKEAMLKSVEAELETAS
jgi:hypothetical protein